jgi:hypothetical protein
VKRHAPPPAPCEDCLALIHAVADTRPLEETAMKFCPHNGVLAVARRIAGAIVTWHLEGPLSNAEAIEVAETMQGILATEGLKVHEIATQ